LAGVTTAVGSPYPFLDTPLYFSNTTISGGGYVGLDWCIWNRLSFVFQVDFLGQGPLHAANNIGSEVCTTNCPAVAGCNLAEPCVALNTAAASTTNLVGPAFGTEVVFPVLFGLKYYF